MARDPGGRGDGQLDLGDGALLSAAAKGDTVPAAWQNIIPSNRGNVGSIAAQRGGIATVAADISGIGQVGFHP